MSEITALPSITSTDGCLPMCADYFTCGQTYGGCFTSCPGVPTPEPTIPDYVVSACIAQGSWTSAPTGLTRTDIVITVTTDTASATSTTETTETINTVGTESGIVTILTETNPTEAGTTTLVTSSATEEILTNGTTTGGPEPSESEPSVASLGKGAIKLGVVFGVLISFIFTGGAAF
ncbi:hypothetical protein ABW19_dt0205502 [Dactylella cylindrospora]|nr:hypothetical protein ABW19_dt0205502 [Dactylella cylindrospora]